MSRSNMQLDAWLNELGKARNEGLFTQPAARTLPWQSAARPVTATNGSARRAFWGFAAAACVGLVLVGVWRVEPLLTNSLQTAAPRNNLALASRETVATKQNANVSAPAVKSLPKDFDANGDGRVDGNDIQVYLNQQAHKPEGDVDASDFTRRLLGL